MSRFFINCCITRSRCKTLLCHSVFTILMPFDKSFLVILGMELSSQEQSLDFVTQRPDANLFENVNLYDSYNGGNFLYEENSYGPDDVDTTISKGTCNTQQIKIDANGNVFLDSNKKVQVEEILPPPYYNTGNFGQKYDPFYDLEDEDPGDVEMVDLEDHNSHENLEDFEDMNNSMENPEADPSKKSVIELPEAIAKFKDISPEDILEGLKTGKYPALKPHEKWIPTSDQGGKYSEKYNFCRWCLCLVRYIARHYQTTHKRLLEVKRIVDITDKNVKRREWTKLSGMGNLIFNMSKDFNPTGEQIVARRKNPNKGNYKKPINNINPDNVERKKLLTETMQYLDDKYPELSEEAPEQQPKETAGKKPGNQDPIKDLVKTSRKGFGRPDKIPCTVCFVLFSPSYLKTHYLKIHNLKQPPGSRKGAIQSKALLIPANQHCSRRVAQILGTGLNDEVANVMRNDFAILLYGDKMAFNYQGEHHNSMIRSYMRLFAKLLIELKSHDSEIMELADVLNPDKWNLCLECILSLCEYDEDLDQMKNPYNGETFVRIIRHLCKWLKCYFTKHRLEKRKNDLMSFMEVFEGDHDMVSGKASQTRKKIARTGGKEDLPTDRDVKIFNSWVAARFDTALKKLVHEYSETDYKVVLEMTALDLLLLNNKRPGETQRVELVDWNAAKQFDKESSEYALLEQDNRNQLEKYARVDMQGKKEDGQGSIYVDLKHQLAVSLILRYRKNYGVAETNKYLFAEKYNSLSIIQHPTINLCRILTREAKACSDIWQPIDYKLMTTIKLRVRAATKMAQDENMLQYKDLMMRHFEHTERTHDKFYARRPDKSDAIITRNLELLNMRRESGVIHQVQMPGVIDQEQMSGVIQQEQMSGVIHGEHSSYEVRENTRQIDDHAAENYGSTGIILDFFIYNHFVEV